MKKNRVFIFNTALFAAFITIILALPSLGLSGCVSVMEKAGRVLDGSAFKEKKIARYCALKKDGAAEDMELTLVQNKENSRSVLISLNRFPMMFLRASEPDENGAFYLTSLEYLSGGIQNWNEYTLDLIGEGKLSIDETEATASFTLNGEIEPVQISAGRIHRFDSRITGSDALTGLRNRKERITATVAWMLSQENAPKGKGLSIEYFEEYWERVLFPEMVSKNKRPSDWLQEGDIFEKGEDIRWNTGYTERIFSEELWPVRNSGTMLRDWEEAISWLYLEYQWDYIKEILSQQTLLKFYK